MRESGVKWCLRSPVITLGSQWEYSRSCIQFQSLQAFSLYCSLTPVVNNLAFSTPFSQTPVTLPSGNWRPLLDVLCHHSKNLITFFLKMGNNPTFLILHHHTSHDPSDKIRALKCWAGRFISLWLHGRPHHPPRGTSSPHALPAESCAMHPAAVAADLWRRWKLLLLVHPVFFSLCAHSTGWKLQEQICKVGEMSHTCCK